MRIRNRTSSVGESSAGIGNRCRFRDGNVPLLYHPSSYDDPRVSLTRSFERYVVEATVSFLIFVQSSTP